LTGADSEARNILVTGDAGFIGAHLKAALEGAGHRVAGYDRRNAHELQNLALLEAAVSRSDVVFHVAAQPDLNQMAASLGAARMGVLDNVEATHNVAYACAKHRVRLIHASTIAVYGDKSAATSLEDTTFAAPAEIYAASKHAAEALVRGYGDSFQMPWTILRIGTVYGPRMRAGLGLHVFFQQALAGQPITLHGDGSQVRALLFIDDLIAAMMSALAGPHAAQAQIINLAGGELISARRMAEDVVRISGSRSPIITVPQRENQVMRERVDTSKAGELLTWTPETSWAVGLEKTHQWIRAQHLAQQSSDSTQAAPLRC
jgi:nucleoside-diphosphate-sugar epimerase